MQKCSANASKAVNNFAVNFWIQGAPVRHTTAYAPSERVAPVAKHACTSTIAVCAATQPEDRCLVIACSRRELTLAAAVAALTTTKWLLPQQAKAGSSSYVDPQLLQAFQEALAARTYEDIDAAWTKAISISPNNAAAWSNRGTARLQNGQWQTAYEDLSTALQLEQQQTGTPSALLLNNLGNAEGGLGRWGDAMQHYQQAALDSEMGSIALANYALGAFETKQDELAIKSARQLLRRDPEFMDMRCALAAFLWGTGRRAEAEDTWEQLQQNSDGLGAAIYSRSTAAERVRHRWPPRATAALVAFLSLSDVGQAEGYDLQMHEYRFAAAG